MAPPLAGPPGQPEGDMRLDFLKDNQQGVVDDQPGAQSLMRQLLPLVLAQGLDLAQTQRGLRSVPMGNGWTQPTREGNPLPGMQSTGGRLGWGAFEALLAAALLAKKPSIGVPVRNALVGTHTGLARGWQDLINEQNLVRTRAGYLDDDQK